MAELKIVPVRTIVSPEERKRRLSRVYTILLELAVQTEAACLHTHEIDLSHWVELGPSLW